MSELVSAYPTAGGIYWWAATMGKPIHGWFTGWLNLIGLIAVTASVDYGCATFLNLTLKALLGEETWAGTLNHAFLLFVIILAAARDDQHLRAPASSTCCRTSRSGGTCSARPRSC